MLYIKQTTFDIHYRYYASYRGHLNFKKGIWHKLERKPRLEESVNSQNPSTNVLCATAMIDSVSSVFFLVLTTSQQDKYSLNVS